MPALRSNEVSISAVTVIYKVIMKCGVIGMLSKMCLFRSVQKHLWCSKLIKTHEISIYYNTCLNVHFNFSVTRSGILSYTPLAAS